MVWTTDEIVERATTHLNDGEFVYLGPGLPAAVASRIPADTEVWLHVHDGVPGMMSYPTDDYMDAGFIAGSRERHADARQREVYHSTDSFAEMTSASMDMAIIDASGQYGNGVAIAQWAIGSGARNVVLLLQSARGIKDIADSLMGSEGDGVSYRIISDSVVVDVTPKGVTFVEAMNGTTRADIEALTSLGFA
ncbi:hypothetical protein [Cupriavidus sp. RAF12]|uniref:hypothetical protein n=1 Tax=Cupriavidus sp. RAF12 TaxID=3233050 RepID=UPI003F92D340